MQQLLTIITTVIITYTTMVSIPHVKKYFKSIKSRLKRRQHTQPNTDLQSQIDDLQSQINNLIEVKYNRDTNRKNNIRRDVRDYLNELKND
jgi:gluconate kinase